MKRKIALLMTMVMMAVTLGEAYMPVRAEECSEEVAIDDSEGASVDDEAAFCDDSEVTCDDEAVFCDNSKVTCDETVFSDDETDVFEDEDIVTEEAAGAVTVKAVSENAGSHAVRVIITYDDYYSSVPVMVVSKEGGVGSTADENGRVAALSAKETPYETAEGRTYTSSDTDSGKRYYFVYTFTGLECSQKYYYRMAAKGDDDSYTFITEERVFTTSAEVSSSAVTLKDPGVVEQAFGNVTFGWDYNDPNDEIVIKSRLYYGEGEEDYKDTGYAYQRSGDAKQSSLKMNFSADKVLKLTPAFLVYIGDELTWVKRETFTVSLIPMTDENVYISTVVGAGSFTVSARLIPKYKDELTYLRIYYKKDGAASYQTNFTNLGLGSYASACTGGYGLDEKSSYKYYINITADFNGTNVLWSKGSAEEPLEFTTGENVLINMRTAFPDPVFRTLILDKLEKTEEQEVHASDLEKIHSLIKAGEETDAAYISDIRGAELLINLEELNLSRHNIGNITPLTGLKQLRYFMVSNNDITSLPDLSGLAHLEQVGLGGNRIPADEWTNEKLPPYMGMNKFADARIGQRKALSAFYAEDNTYYAIGNTHPFIAGFTGLRENARNYSVTAAIEGEAECELTRNKTGDEYPFICTDMGAGASGEKKVRVTVKENDVIIYDETQTFVFESDYMPPHKQSYEEGLSVNGYLNGTVTKDEIEYVTLFDDKGNILSADYSTFSLSTSTSESRYYPVFRYEGLTMLSHAYTNVMLHPEFAELPAAGVYTMGIKLKNSEDIIPAALLTMSYSPVIYYEPYYYFNSAYDNNGDRVFIKLPGPDINESTAPEIMFGNRKAAEYEGCFGTGDGVGNGSKSITYIYRKLNKEEFWIDNTGFDLVFPEATGVETKSLIYKPYGKTVQMDGTIFCYYNDREDTGELKMYFRTCDGYEEGRNLKLTVQDSKTKEVLATSETTVSEGMAAFICRKADGSVFDFPMTRKYYLIIDDNKTVRQFYWEKLRYNCKNPETAARNERVVLMQDPYISEGQTEVSFRLFIRNEISADDIRAYFNNKTAIMYPDESADSSVGKYFIASVKFDEGLAERRYSLEVFGDGRIADIDIYAVGNSLSQYSQDMSAESVSGDKETVCVNIGIPKAVSENILGRAQDAGEYMKKHAIDVSFTEYGSMKAISSSFVRAEWDEKGINAYYELDGIHFILNAKVTAGGEVFRQFGSIYSFYSGNNGNVQVGKEHRLSTKPVYRLREREYDDKGQSCYEAVTAKGVITYPVNAVFMRPYSGEIISSFTINGPEEHVFTDTDLKGMVPDEVYSLHLFDHRGYSTEFTGYFRYTENKEPDPNNDPDKPGPDDDSEKETEEEEPEIPVTMTLDNTVLEMDMFGETVLTAVFTPEDKAQEVIWSSSDRSKVRVDANGKVKAWKPTRGVPVIITAVTSDGELKAECSVTVSEKSFDDTDKQIRISPEDIDSFVIPDKVNKVFGSMEVNLGKKKGKVTVASMSVNYVNAVMYNGKAIKDPAVLDIDFDATPVLKAAGIDLKTEDIVSVNYVFKNSKDASAGVTKDSKKSYYYIKLKINKGAAKLINDKAKYSTLKKIVAAVNKNLKAKENRVYFTINKAFFVDSNVSVYVKGGVVALNSKGALKGFKKVTVKLPGDTKEKKLANSMFYKKEMQPDVAANTVRVKGKKNYTGSVTVGAK